MKFNLRSIAALAALISGSGPALLAATLSVPTAYPTIQSAVTAAVAGDIVAVEPGLYREAIHFGGKGITIRSTQGPAVTTIQPLNSFQTVVSFLRGEPPTATLEGFTLRGGAIGIHLATTLPTIRNNVITQNELGIHLSFASPNILGNTISSNSPNGGIYIQGSCTAQIIGNNISYNNDTSAGGGAAIEMFAAGTPTIRNNLISYNTAPSGGGGAITMVNISDALIEQNLIIRNEAGNNGTISWLAPSGANGARVINNTIAFNNSTLAAGIAADGFDATAEIINNIVYASGSQTAIWVGGFNDPNLPLIRTNLVFSETGAPYAGIAADQTGLNGNISGDPLFANASANDFHLRAGSPAIDVALASRAPAADFAGLARPVDGNEDGTAAPDLGVYEFLGVNHPPVAEAKSLEVAEDGSGVVQLSGYDQDGDTLTFQIISNPAHGSLLVNGQNVTYTPNANFNGTDSFSYIANDSEDDSAPAAVSVNVTPVNDSPTASGTAVTIAEDTASVVTLVAHDLDNDPLTYVISLAPSHGTISGSGANVIYTPAANFHGSDSLEFVAHDSSSASAAVTVLVTVTPVNDAPVANALALSLSEDTSLAIALSGSDVDGDTLTFTVVTQPANGTLSVANNQLVYAPNANFNGADEFTYVANDGSLDSASATVALTVQPANDLPVANSATHSTPENQSFSFTLTGSDIDGDTLTHRITRPPAHGSLGVTGNTIQYWPEPNYNGPDSLEFVMNDGAGDSAVARIDITITPVNNPPVANNGAFSGPEDTLLPLALSASDLDGDALSFIIVTGPEHGTLSGTGPNFSYKPAQNFHGGDSFTYKVNDGSANSEVATVFIVVTPVNDAPVAVEPNVFLLEDTSRSITVSGTDVDGDALTYSLKQAPLHGTLSGTAPNFVYTPAPNYFGPDSFRFYVDDGRTASHGTVSIFVGSVNDVPVAKAKSITLLEDRPADLTLEATDVDGDALTYSIVTGPAHGTLSGTAPNLFYTPAAHYFGTDSFVFRASDGRATSEPEVVTVTVTPVNDAPTFTLADQTILARKNAGLETYPNWVQNLSPGPNESNQAVSLSIISVSQPDLFEVQPAITAPGTLTFNPRQGRVGSATVTVKALDNGGTANEGVDRSTQSFTIVVDSQVSLSSGNRPLNGVVKK
jgi:parallel beta-helix repeat protein